MFRNIKTLKHIQDRSPKLLGATFMDIQNISNHSPSINQHKKLMTSNYQNMSLINNNCYKTQTNIFYGFLDWP